jgi:hypothetical protein
MKESKQKAFTLTIFETIQGSSQLQDLLTIAISASQKTFFIAKLLIAYPDAFSGHTHPPPELFDILTIWWGKFKEARFDAVATAFNLRRKNFLDNRNIKLDFIHRIGLNWSPHTRDSFFKNVRTVYLPKLSTPYPPVNHWMCETNAIDNKWRNYLKYDPRAQPDKRRDRLPIFRTDPSNLSLDIGADESVIVRDADTGELIMIVLREFCTDPELLSYIEEIIKQAVQCRRSVRVSHSNRPLIPFIYFR